MRKEDILKFNCDLLIKLIEDKLEYSSPIKYENWVEKFIYKKKIKLNPITLRSINQTQPKVIIHMEIWKIFP